MTQTKGKLSLITGSVLRGEKKTQWMSKQNVFACCHVRIKPLLQVKENSAPFLRVGKSLELCMLDLALTVFFFHKML